MESANQPGSSAPAGGAAEPVAAASGDCLPQQFVAACQQRQLNPDFCRWHQAMIRAGVFAACSPQSCPLRRAQLAGDDGHDPARLILDPDFGISLAQLKRSLGESRWELLQDSPETLRDCLQELRSRLAAQAPHRPGGALHPQRAVNPSFFAPARGAAPAPASLAKAAALLVKQLLPALAFVGPVERGETALRDLFGQLAPACGEQGMQLCLVLQLHFQAMAAFAREMPAPPPSAPPPTELARQQEAVEPQEASLRQLALFAGPAAAPRRPRKALKRQEEELKRHQEELQRQEEELQRQQEALAAQQEGLACLDRFAEQFARLTQLLAQQAAAAGGALLTGRGVPYPASAAAGDAITLITATETADAGFLLYASLLEALRPLQLAGEANEGVRELLGDPSPGDPLEAIVRMQILFCRLKEMSLAKRCDSVPAAELVRLQQRYLSSVERLEDALDAWVRS